jgi:hypothetical protein
MDARAAVIAIERAPRVQPVTATPMAMVPMPTPTPSPPPAMVSPLSSASASSPSPVVSAVAAAAISAVAGGRAAPADQEMGRFGRHSLAFALAEEERARARAGGCGCRPWSLPMLQEALRATALAGAGTGATATAMPAAVTVPVLRVTPADVLSVIRSHASSSFLLRHGLSTGTAVAAASPAPTPIFGLREAHELYRTYLAEGRKCTCPVDGDGPAAGVGAADPWAEAEAAQWGRSGVTVHIIEKKAQFDEDTAAAAADAADTDVDAATQRTNAKAAEAATIANGAVDALSRGPAAAGSSGLNGSRWAAGMAVTVALSAAAWYWYRRTRRR